MSGQSRRRNRRRRRIDVARADGRGRRRLGDRSGGRLGTSISCRRASAPTSSRRSTATRARNVDAYAVESQRRAAARAADGLVRRARSSPVKDVRGDVALDARRVPAPRHRPRRPGEAQARLRAARARRRASTPWRIQKYPQVEAIEHVHTAGNSSGIVDGAAAVLIGSKRAGARPGSSRAHASARSPRSAASRRSC